VLELGLGGATQSLLRLGGVLAGASGQEISDAAENA
jgi:hypothetical protein